MRKELTLRNFVLILTDKIMNYTILTATILVPLWTFHMFGIA